MNLPIAGSVTSGVHATESLLFLVLLQLTVIVLAGRAGSALAPEREEAVARGTVPG